MKPLTYVVAALLGCAAAVVLSANDGWWATDPPASLRVSPGTVEPAAEPKPPSPDPATRFDSLEQTLAGLGARLQTLERLVVANAGAARTAAVTQHVPPAESLPEQVPESQPDPDARYHEMQDRLARQTPDPGREVMAMTDITTTFERAAPPGTVIDNVACRGRICRVDLRHEPGATLDELLLSDALAPWPHRGAAHAIDEESSVVFLESEQP